MGLKPILVVIFSVQLLTQTVLSVSNGTDDAQDALILLSNEISATNKSVTTGIPDIWEISINRTMETIIEEYVKDVGNFSVLLNNITGFTNSVIGGLDCVNGLNKTSGLKETDEGSKLGLWTEIFSNLLSLAKVEVESVAEQFEELDSEFKSNCVEKKNNCDGVSSYVTAEVERLLLVLKRIKIDFLAEVHVLEYKYFVYWKSSRAILVTGLNAGIKNATTCLASKIEDHIKQAPASAIGSTYNAKDSIIDIFYDLVYLSIKLYLESLERVESYTKKFLNQTNREFVDTVFDIRNAIFKANQTINVLRTIAPEFNSTVNCAVPDLHTVVNSSVIRAFQEYNKSGPLALNASHKGAIGLFDGTLSQVKSILSQVNGCTADTNCDYLLEKIAKRSTVVPVTFSGFANSTSLLMHEAVLSVRESGIRIVNDILEELEVEIVGLKSCIRYNLY